MVEHLKEPSADDELGHEKMTMEMNRRMTSQEITGQEMTGLEMKKKKRNKKKNKKSKKGKAQPKKEGGNEDEEKKGVLSGKVFIDVFVVLFLFLGVLLQIVIVRAPVGSEG